MKALTADLIDGRGPVPGRAILIEAAANHV
jgi:hypothetical protein